MCTSVVHNDVLLASIVTRAYPLWCCFVFTNLAITLKKLSSQSGNNNQTVYLYVPLAVLTSLYPQMITNVSVLALLFLELCL